MTCLIYVNEYVRVSLCGFVFACPWVWLRVRLGAGRWLCISLYVGMWVCICKSVVLIAVGLKSSFFFNFSAADFAMATDVKNVHYHLFIYLFSSSLAQVLRVWHIKGILVIRISEFWSDFRFPVSQCRAGNMFTRFRFYALKTSRFPVLDTPFHPILMNQCIGLSAHSTDK